MRALDLKYREEREFKANTAKIIVTGVIGFDYICSDKRCLIVCSKKENWFSVVDTYYEGDTLFIGLNSSYVGNVVGDGNIQSVVGVQLNKGCIVRNIVGNGNVIGSCNVQLNSRGTIIGNGNVQIDGIGSVGSDDIVNALPDMLAILLMSPELPSFEVDGCVDAALYGVEQVKLKLRVNGAGKITVAKGKVNELKARVHGAGEVNARELIAETAELEVHGAGKLKAFVTGEANVEVHGAGDIKLWGKPNVRHAVIRGAGSLKLKD
jgi:hypothetical protein